MQLREMPTRCRRPALACLTVILVTSMAVDAAEPRLSALYIMPGVVTPGDWVKAAVELTHPAPSGGVDVALEAVVRCRACGSLDEPARVFLPREIHIPAGRTVGHFEVDVATIRDAADLVVTAVLRDSRQSAVVLLMP